MSVLKLGARGAAVRSLQTMLNAYLVPPVPPIVVDGDFGRATEQAVRAAQVRLKLVLDGVAGPQTQTALKQATTPAKPGIGEPDKSAMNTSPPAGSAKADRQAPPVNAATVKLLTTARPINEIIIHCTATPEGTDFTVDNIRTWHKARGWSDIGYHYVVYRDGRVMLGRPVGQVGSHVAGHNTGTVGIAYVGGVTADGKQPKDTRTPAQRSSLLWLTAQLRSLHSGITKVSGHNQYAAKACPSFDVRKDPLGA